MLSSGVSESRSKIGVIKEVLECLRERRLVARIDEQRRYAIRYHLWHRGIVEESWTPTGVPFVWRASYRYQTAGASSLMRSWSRQEVAHLADTGLHVESVWGDFNEGPFHDESERIIVVGHL